MPEPLQVERYRSSSTVEPEVLWSLVGDPARLPEWTDAREVGPSSMLSEGAEIVVRSDEAWQTWRVLTAAPYGWEITTTLEIGDLALGCRVARERSSDRLRLVLVAVLEPAGSRLRGRLLVLPRLGGRLERWAQTAMRLAGP